MGWITSWPSVIVGCAGLLVCAAGLMIETFKPDKPRHLCTALRCKRAKEKAAARTRNTDSGKR